MVSAGIQEIESVIARAAALLLAALLSVAAARAEVAVPPLAARVTDLTATLTPAQRDMLERRLADFEKRKGSQIAVLLVPSTAPEAIEQYSIRVAEAWKLGRKGVDDGVLLLVAKNDRKLRIEVGYGLEGVVPDAVAKRVIAETISPHFKRGDFAGGIEAGVDQLIRIVDGESLPPPARRERSADRIGDLIDLAPIFFIGILIGGGLLRAIFGRLIGGSLAGGLIGVIAWIIAGVVVGAVAGVIAFVLVVAAGTTIGRGGSGGWSSGGWSGGGSSGGDSGGFSGGGGDFGGGGASGDW
jgi:uncharacterized protein